MCKNNSSPRLLHWNLEKKLQKNFSTLLECHIDLKRLLMEASDGQHDSASEWFNHLYVDTFIGKNSMVNHQWILGDQKIQKNNFDDMTMNKGTVCKMLKNVNQRCKLARRSDGVKEQKPKNCRCRWSGWISFHLNIQKCKACVQLFWNCWSSLVNGF